VEALRWILLAAGIVFVLVIYFLGRSRRRRKHSMVDEMEENMPEFTAQSLDDLDEGVGKVRVITATDDGEVGHSGAGHSKDDYSDAENLPPLSVMDEDQQLKSEPQNASTSHTDTNTTDSSNRQRDIIVLYILPKPDKTLIGSQINSSAQAMGLSFGEMNIFHFMVNNRSVFSLANMLEPGSFDADTIHDLKTTGLTVFMQIQGGDPLDDLTEMLQRSYQLAGLLDARLCNHKRQPLTEQDAENYRSQVSEFAN